MILSAKPSISFIINLVSKTSELKKKHYLINSILKIYKYFYSILQMD